MSLSKILDIMQRREIGLYDGGSFRGLFGFGMVMMIAIFHLSGI